ncbi:hypothetical protein ABH935_009877 [Catenulispora sp. GAS73]
MFRQSIRPTCQKPAIDLLSRSLRDQSDFGNDFWFLTFLRMPLMRSREAWPLRSRLRPEGLHRGPAAGSQGHHVEDARRHHPAHRRRTPSSTTSTAPWTSSCSSSPASHPGRPEAAPDRGPSDSDPASHRQSAPGRHRILWGMGADGQAGAMLPATPRSRSDYRTILRSFATWHHLRRLRAIVDRQPLTQNPGPPTHERRLGLGARPRRGASSSCCTLNAPCASPS